MNLRFLKKVFQQNRLKYYKDILVYAKNNGYVLTSLIDWYENYLDCNKKVLILRHDVDYDAKGALSMYKVEKELGAKSSFYFRWLTVNDNIMQTINKDGFEVSLHYETLATYAKQNNLFKTEDITEDILNICFDNLITEINTFERRFWKIKTICSHGDKRNRILKVSNYKIINKEKLKSTGLEFNVYDKEIMNKFDAYISDSSIYSDFNWKHYGSPYEAIDNKLNTVCLLTHPIHWNQNIVKNIDMLKKVYSDNK